MMNDVSSQSGVPMTSALIRLLLASVGMFLLILFGFSGAAGAATITVNSTFDAADTNPADGVCNDTFGKCSLRAAVMQTNALSGADTIIVPPGRYTLRLGGARESNGASGDLDILDDLTIIGAGGNPDGDPALTIIEGGDSPGTGIDRVIEVNPNLDQNFQFALKSVTIRYGKNNTDPVYGGSYGGGIVADIGSGSLLISNSIISDNTAEDSGNGGGLSLWGLSGGTIRIEKSVIRNNTAAADGGGLQITSDSTIQIVDTTIANNSASEKGGGVYFAFYGIGSPQGATIENSTVSENTANDNGGGIALTGNTWLKNVTVSGNASKSYGGGIAANAAANAVKLTNVTVANNQANSDDFGIETGGGVYAQNQAPTLYNTIVANNKKGGGASDDVAGPADPANSNNFIGMPASWLGALADNGGLTQTHALLNGSPAIDAGDNSKASAAGITVDQRGTPRVVDSADGDSIAATDIGAYEAHATISDIANQSTAANTPKSAAFNVGGSPLVGAITASSSNQAVIPDGNIQITGSGENRTITVTPAAGQVGKPTITVSVAETGGGPTATDTFDVDVTSSPDLTITKSHSGNFTQGQSGTYTILVSNTGVGPNIGTVTVTDTLPAGLTATAISGTGWACDAGTLTCTRPDALNNASSYPAITVTVNVAANAPGTVTNSATVSGGGDVNAANNSASDPTTIEQTAGVVSVAVPSDGTYGTGQSLDFAVRFSQNVTVTGGTPSIPLTIGGTTADASYISGTGTTDLVFRYTVQAGDIDSDGISLDGAITLNGASIIDSVTTNNANVTLNGVGSTAGVKVDAVPPTVTSVSVPADGSYGLGGNLAFTVNYDEPVTVSGSLSIDLTIGSQTVEAAYTAGSGSNALQFTYTIAAGDNDADGIGIGNVIKLNSGSLQDAAGNDASPSLNGVGSTTGVIVDSQAPAVSSVSVPTVGSYREGQNLDFAVNFDEVVAVAGGIPSLDVTVGATSRPATYVSGTGTPALTFRYTVQTGDVDIDGVQLSNAIALNGASLKDPAGNDANLSLNSVPDTSGILVDTAAPVVGSVTVPPNGTYRAGDQLDFAVTFSESVAVNTTGGTPVIPLDVGGTMVNAQYVSGSGSNTLVFRYTAATGRSDVDGIEVGSAIALNSGSIKDGAGNDSGTTLTAVPDTSGILVDAVVPSVTSVTPPADKTYLAGEIISFAVNFSENVTVAGGTPSLPITIGSATEQAVYESGTGTASLTFTYTVEAGDNDSDGISLESALSLNGAAIQDAIGNDADLTINGAPSTGNIRVDAVVPSVSSVVVPAAGTYPAGQTLAFTVNASEPVMVDTAGGLPDIQLTVGADSRTASYISGSGSNALIFAYTIQPGDDDADGIELGILRLNGATISDAAGNDLNTALNGAGDLTGVRVKTSQPTVVSVGVPANGSYPAGVDLDFTVKFDGIVTVAGGTPAIELAMGGTTREASYVMGTGTDTLAFRYTVAAGDEDADGIQVGAALLLNGSTINDAAGNPAVLDLNGVGNTSAVLVDTTTPTVPTIDLTAGAMFNTSDITFTGTGEPGSTIELFVDSTSEGTATVAGDGKWSLTVAGVTEALHQVKSQATDAAGNKSAESTPLNFTVDLTAPSKPVITLSETGWTKQDVTVTVAGEAGAVIEYRLGGRAWQTYPGTAIVITTEGTTDFTARQLDGAQNESDEEKVEIFIDKTAPVITLKGAATMNVYNGSTFNDPGVTITDNLAAGLTPSVTGTVDTNSLGTYTLQYDTADLAGNQANPVIRTVKVVNRPAPPPVTYPVTGVSLDEKKLAMTTEDDPVTLHATVRPENATNKAVVWSSSDPNVATVSGAGVVTPVGPGKATITVTTVDGNYTAESTVTVVGEQTLIGSEKSFLISPNRSVSFKIYVLEEDGKRKEITKSTEISYEASNSLITVKPGFIRAGKQEGEAVITVRYQEDELEIPVTVTQNSVRKLDSSPTRLYLPLESSKQIAVKAIYEDKTSEDITEQATWTTSNTKAATVSDTGEITAVGTGTATITASYGGKKISIWVKAVKEIALKRLSVSQRFVTLAPDETAQIKLTASYEDGGTEDASAKAEWTVSNEKIATVENGLVKGIAPGRTKVSARYKGKTVYIYVTVK